MLETIGRSKFPQFSSGSSSEVLFTVIPHYMQHADISMLHAEFH